MAYPDFRILEINVRQFNSCLFEEKLVKYELLRENKKQNNEQYENALKDIIIEITHFIIKNKIDIKKYLDNDNSYGFYGFYVKIISHKDFNFIINKEFYYKLKNLKKL